MSYMVEKHEQIFNEFFNIYPFVHSNFTLMSNIKLKKYLKPYRNSFNPFFFFNIIIASLQHFNKT